MVMFADVNILLGHVERKNLVSEGIGKLNSSANKFTSRSDKTDVVRSASRQILGWNRGKILEL